MFFPYFSRTPQRVALLEGEKKNLERSARLVDAESKRERECAESRERTARAHIAGFKGQLATLREHRRRELDDGGGGGGGAPPPLP